MNITQVLFKLQNAMVAKKNPAFTVPVEKQKKYVAHFSEPKDDFERSYCQYRCQTMMRGRFMNSLVSVASLPVTVLLMIKYRKAPLPEKETPCDNRAVFFRDGKPANIMANELQDEFNECITDPIEGSCLLKEDLGVIRELICRHPLSWQLVLKTVIKIARYRYALEKYGPRALIVCNEFSYTSSVLTEFCSRNHVELINVMHGEKCYNIRDSFFHFHRCYVWDEHYVKLFVGMRAERSQFRIAVPTSLRFHVEQMPEKCYDYTYYLGGESKDEINAICNTLTRLAAQGMRVNIRPHPRYTNMEELNAVCNGVSVESCADVTIEQSVLRSQAVISQFSTVLLQAYYNDVDVVIDDMVNPAQYQKLEELQFALLNMKHMLLSQMMGEYK